jgi:acetyl-CoA synthetase
MRTVYGDHERFVQTYFSSFKGAYFTGDGARRDEDGYYWITGRVDDVINVSGHRIGTAEVESALVGHQSVAEAAVVGYPHDIKGQGIYCFVTLKLGEEVTEVLKADLRGWVRREIGPFAAPDVIQFAPGLPKTRSGKIMRRILRKIAEDDLSNLGDTSTLADPAVVDDLVKNRAARRGEEQITAGGQKLHAPDIEAVLRSHPDVVDAAVVGVARGTEEAVFAYVKLEPDVRANDVLQADLKGWIRREIGPAAVPEAVHFARDLPRTEAGELVRPLLRRIAEGDRKAASETAGLADPSLVEELLDAQAATPA